MISAVLVMLRRELSVLANVLGDIHSDRALWGSHPQ
jgi:hypothetical protein